VIKDYFYHYEIKNNDFTIDLSNKDVKYLAKKLFKKNIECFIHER